MAGVGAGAGDGVGTGDVAGTGAGLGEGIGTGEGIRVGVGTGVGDGVDSGDGTGEGPVVGIEGHCNSEIVFMNETSYSLQQSTCQIQNQITSDNFSNVSRPNSQKSPKFEG